MLDVAPIEAKVETIIVTGRPLERTAADAAYGGVLLDANALTSASGRTEDALRAVAGVQLFRRSSSRTANPTAEGVTARGFSGNAASRLLVTLDGVPQADPFFGFVAWPALSARPLGSALVVRGGGAAAAGPGALVGTIAFESAAGSEAMIRGGSRGSGEGRLALGFDAGAGRLSLFGGLSEGRGHLLVAAPGPADVPTRYSQWATGGRALLPVAGGELQAGVSAFSDSRLRGIEGADIRSTGGDASLRFVKRGGWELEAVAWAQLRDLATRTRVLDSARATTATTLDQLETPSTGLGARLELRAPGGARFGADLRHADGRTRERFRFIAGIPTRERLAGGSNLTAGLFAEAGLTLSETLEATAATRIDHWRLGAGELSEISIPEGSMTLSRPSPARTGWEPTARVALVWQPASAFTLRSAGYTGWRLPTLNELHRPFRVGADATAANPALSPERLFGADLGLAFQPLANASLSLTGFANRLEKPIANVTIASGPGVFPGVGFVAANGFYRQRQNLEAIDSLGLEADARLGIGNFDLAASLAWQDATVRGGALEGLEPAQTPSLSAAASIAWSADPFGATLAVRHSSAVWEDDRNSRRLAPATIVDVGLAANIGQGLSLTLAAENIFDAAIETGFSGAQTELGQPRTLWFGVRWDGS